MISGRIVYYNFIHFVYLLARNGFMDVMGFNFFSWVIAGLGSRRADPGPAGPGSWRAWSVVLVLCCFITCNNSVFDYDKPSAW